jgi:peroxiredoxin
MKILALIAVVILAITLLFFAYHTHSHHPTDVGVKNVPTRVQDVLLTDLDGKQFRASDYHGKVLLVNFWAAWCAPCAEEIPQFVGLQSKYRDQGLQVVGISVEDVESVLRSFCLRNHVNYPVVPGDQKVADSFGGVLGLPTTFLIDKDGLVYRKYSGATDFAVVEHDMLALLPAARK